MWASLSNWISACDRIIALGATVLAPGHGPVTDDIDITDFADWSDPERLAANVIAAYRELDPTMPAPTALELFTEMARWRAAH